MKVPIIKVILRNYAEPIEVTSIDFITRTLTWNYMGRYIKDIEFSDVESWEVTQ